MSLVLVALRDGHDIERSMAPYRGVLRSDARVAERSQYLKCPDCSQLMNRTKLIGDAGIVVDMCLEHGVWFDRGELAHAAEYVQETGHRVGRDKASAEARSRIAAALGRYFNL